MLTPLNVLLPHVKTLRVSISYDYSPPHFTPSPSFTLKEPSPAVPATTNPLFGALDPPSLLTACPNLTSLALIDEAEALNMGTVFAAVLNPQFLLSLSIRFDGWSSNLQISFSRFTSLVEFSIGGFIPTHPLFSSFLSDPLPLEHLTFGHCSPITIRELISLVNDPPLSSLRTITLDVLSVMDCDFRNDVRRCESENDETVFQRKYMQDTTPIC